MIESERELRRRDLAVKVAEEIIQHPAYPFIQDDFPRAMVVIIERALTTWEELKNGSAA